MPSRRNLLKAFFASPFALGWRRLPGAPVEDAAPAYRRAFELVPEWKEAEYKTLREAAKTPLDANVRKMVKRSEAMLSAFRDATQHNVCTWKPVRGDEDLGRDQLDFRAANIARVAILRARLRLAAKQDNAAIDDLFAVARFGRHVSRSGVMIAELYGLTFENQALIVLGAALSNLSEAVRNDIRRRVDELPAVTGWDVILREESEYIMSILRTQMAKTGWPKTVDDLGDTRDEAERVFALTKGDRTKTLAMIDNIGPRIRGLEADLKLPYRHFKERIGPLTEQFKKVNPWVASVMPNLGGTKWSVDRTATLWLMLRAAILRFNGDLPGFAAIRDPGGDGPFACTDREGGFLLESALRDEGTQAITLEFGPRRVKD